MFQTFIFVLATPSMLYGAIAGEREKRTWDLLMVAPITQGQIVAGKFIGALVAIGVGFGLFALPILVTAIEYERTNWWDLLLAEGVSASFIVMIAAITLFLSARAKRGFMALGTMLAGLAIFLLVVPMLTAFVLNEPVYADLINFFHPFYVQMELYSTAEQYRGGNDGMNPYSFGGPQVFAYLVLSGMFLVWTARTLSFAENDVKLIPLKNNA
jgi:ABC-type transport system involved in multi-copper enzyme maturation permease subunit